MRILALMTLLLMVVVLACSGGEQTRADCDALGKRCHEAGSSANATATQRECHDKAHEGWTNAECLSNKTRCEAVCPPSDGGHHSSDGG